MKSLTWMALLGLVVSLGCTRKENTVARVELSVPSHTQKLNAQAIPMNYVLKRIMMSVRAADMKVINYVWSMSCESNGCTGTAPATVPLEMDSGSGRMFQFLGVFGNTSDNTEIIYYGDITLDLKPGENEVSIPVSLYGVVGGVQATVFGQYVTSTETTNGTLHGKGPTGAVNIFFQPPNGAPAMVVDTSEMFNGWMTLFGIPGIPFNYVIEATGEKLVHNSLPLTVDNLSNAAAVANDGLVRFDSPAKFYIDDGSGSRRQAQGAASIVGFVGPSASALSPKACYSNFPSLSTFWDQIVGGSQLTFCSSGCTNESIQRKGLGGKEAGDCDIFNQNLISQVQYKPEYLNNGQWGVAPYQSVFKKKYYYHSPGSTGEYGCYMGEKAFDTCLNTMSNSISFQWEYIPFIFDSGAISGVTLFTKVYPDGCSYGQACEAEYRFPNSDLYDCANLESRGFSKVSDFGVMDSTYGLNLANPIPATGSMIALLCPYTISNSKRVYFKTAFRSEEIKSPPPAMGNVQLATNGGDNSADGYLVDANMGSASFMVSGDAIAGATSYQYTVKYGGTARCMATGSLPTMAISGCDTGVGGPSDGGMFMIEGLALDANNRTLGTSGVSFKTVKNIPAGAVSLTNCTNWGTFPYGTRMHISLTGSNFNSFDWFVQYPGTNSSPDIPYSGSTYQLDTGMIDTNAYSGTLSIKLNHVSGYQVSLAPLSFTKDSSNVCAGVP